MNLKTFFEHFDTLAEAPNRIQRLRELILDMAVRGKLVPQDPEDEPADKLLIRVQDKKKKLINLGEVPKPQKITKELNTETLFTLPNGWAWTCLDDISSYIQRGKSPKYDEFGKVYVISQKCIQWKGFDLSKARHIQDDTVPSYGKERFLVPGDLLWNSTGTGTVGRICVLPEKLKEKTMVADSHVTIIRPIECDPRFIYCWLASPFIQEAIEDKTSGTTKQQELNTSTVRLEPVPLPPLAEQKRIVAKVDELMGLCDALEAAQQTRNTLRQNLRASALDALMNAPSDTELETAWAFVRDNWGLMCERAEDVDELRQAILYFSVRGKLVQQFPQEDSANQLLEEIKKNQLSQGRKSRKPKEISQIESLKKPFDIPPQWTWCRFTEVGQLERGKSKHRPRNDPSLYANGSIPLVQTGDVARSKGTVKTCTAFYNEVGLAQSKLWGKGTLCITIAANIADSGILDFEACFPDSVVGFVPAYPITDARYFEFFIRTLKRSLESFAPSTAQKNINLAILDELLIPLPPIAEQKRIVAKVDELMKLCDQLEANLRQQQQKAEAFVGSVVHHFAA